MSFCTVFSAFHRDFVLKKKQSAVRRHDSTAPSRRDDRFNLPKVAGHTMDFALRPGEKLVLRWDNIGKVATPHRDFRHWILVHGPARSTYNGVFL
jgi:hypothetical protein